MEFFGYDIMIDSDFNPWLLEVNSSPTLEYSTGVTTPLSKEVMAAIVEIVTTREMKKKKKGDTGAFKCIYKGKKQPPPMTKAFGLDLAVEGHRMRCPR